MIDPQLGWFACIAKAMHESYEELAPSFGYEMRPELRKPWNELPENLRALMVAAVQMTALKLGGGKP